MTWTHFRDERGSAKTDRKCYLCGKPIPAGEVRTTRVGIDGREFVRMDMHDRCLAATRDWDQTDWETFEPGDLSEHEITRAEQREAARS